MIAEAESFRKASTVLAQSVQTLKKILKNLWFLGNFYLTTGLDHMIRSFHEAFSRHAGASLKCST